MADDALSPGEWQRVDELVSAYMAEREKIDLFRRQLGDALRESTALSRHVHSFRSRLKDPEHLREKLVRKANEARAAGVEFQVTEDNLLTAINDLAGIRILHLYTRQFKDIDTALRAIFDEQRYPLVEAPFARTWDDEYREFFQKCGIETQVSPRLYTSVHYVVGSASRTIVTCEIQVRTLMEEVWGEVDHAINYPHETDVLACREQIKVLARATSTATRLVDAIFLTHDAARPPQEHEDTVEH